MATTILRVKRPLHENPADALLIQCKKPRIDAGPEAPSVFVFSGTTQLEDDTSIRNVIVKHRDKIKEKTVTDVEALKEKIKTSKYNEDYRMKIVNVTRGLDVENETDIPEDYSLWDLQHPKYVENSEQKYTYDLYRYQENNENPIDIDNLEGIYSFQSDLFSSYRDIGQNDPDSDDDDADEDSNEENHWRNEYPDTDDSINEDDMVRVVQNMDLGNDLSSDENDENLYSASSSQQKEINQDDVDKYGLAYAKYKLKVLGDLDDDSIPKLIECDDSNVDENNGSRDNVEEAFCYPKFDDYDDIPSLKSSNSDEEADNILSDVS